MSGHAFWAVVFFSAFAAFTVISALIAVKGIAEIRALFHHLEGERDGVGAGRRREGRQGRAEGGPEV